MSDGLKILLGFLAGAIIVLLFVSTLGGRGMMGSPAQENADNKIPISPEWAREIADDYLGRVSPGTQAGEAEKFYGYYTLHTERDGKITGMLSVNGYSGEVWYHSWHGPFVAMQEGEASH